MNVRLPQHESDPTNGDCVSLTPEGEFSINKHDGLTVLTKAQAEQIAAMLLAWVNYYSEEQPR